MFGLCHISDILFHCVGDKLYFVYFSFSWTRGGRGGQAMALEDDGSEDAVPRPSAAFLVSALAQPTVSARIIQERGLLLDA
jgi:hypothetical protein